MVLGSPYPDWVFEKTCPDRSFGFPYLNRQGGIRPNLYGGDNAHWRGFQILGLPTGLVLGTGIKSAEVVTVQTYMGTAPSLLRAIDSVGVGGLLGVGIWRDASLEPNNAGVRSGQFPRQECFIEIFKKPYILSLILEFRRHAEVRLRVLIVFPSSHFSKVIKFSNFSYSFDNKNFFRIFPPAWIDLPRAYCCPLY